MKVIKKLWALAWVAAFLAVLFSASAMALPTDFSKLYVFGDSLSDTGNDFVLSGDNVPPTTRYYNGRFSNGTVWIETVADAFGINPSHFVPSLSPNATPANFLAGYSLNYAYGGSATGIENKVPGDALSVRGLLGQVADFTSFATAAGGVSDPAHSLYTLWSGANDYLLAGSGGIPGPPPNPVAVVGNIRSSIQQLYDLGARNFLVPRLPELGEIPIVAINTADVRDYFTALTHTHNSLLMGALQELKGIDPGITIYSPDIEILFETVQLNPADFGFTHATTELGPATGCLILPPLVCTALPTGFDGLGYPVWDEEHPAQKMHALIAQAALASEAIPEPSSLVLVLVGGLPLAVRGRALVKRTGRKPAG